MFTSKRKTRFFIDREMISEHLNCPICLDVMDNPTRTRCGYNVRLCRHTFCLACIQDWITTNTRARYCPVCKQPIRSGKQLEKDILPGKIIDDLKVRCTNVGCTWSGRNGNLKHHRAQCQFRVRRQVVEPKNLITIEDDITAVVIQKRDDRLICRYKLIIDES